MGVAEILQQMGEVARRRAAARGAILGGVIADASLVPGQIINDREREALVARQRAMQDEQLGFQRQANARATADQTLQDVAAQRDTANRQALQIGLAAGFGDSSKPEDFNVEKAAAALVKINRADLVPTMQKTHDEMLPKLTSGAPGSVMRNAVTGQVIPGTAIPEKQQPYTINGQRFSGEGTPIGAAVPPQAPAVPTALTPAQKLTDQHERERIALERARLGLEQQKAADAKAGSVSVDLDKLPADQLAQAHALVEGRRSLDPRLASKPYGQAIINAAYQIDPTFDQGNYNARAKARADLTSPSGTGGKTINALNTALQHAGKLSDLIETLDNSNVPAVNAVVNPIRSALGSTKVTNFDTVAPQLAKEIERVWRGAGGTAGEIKDLVDTIGSNKGKQQQREALQQFVDLARGKLNALEQQRDAIMGAAGKSIPVLYDQNQEAIDRIAQRASGTAPTTAKAEAPAGRMRVVGPNGETGTAPIGTPLPPGWKRE